MGCDLDHRVRHLRHRRRRRYHPGADRTPVALWAMAWRARSAARMIRHRRPLEAAL